MKKIMFLFFILFLATGINAAIWSNAEPVVVADSDRTYYADEPEVGYVRAFDHNLHKVIWEIQVYRIMYDENLERDVQWVFITELKVKGNTLIIKNGMNQTFRINTKTGKLIGKTGIVDNRGKSKIPPK